MAPVQPYTDHDSLLRLLDLVRYKNLPANFNLNDADHFRELIELEVRDLIDDLKRLRAIATLRVAHGLTLFPPDQIGTLYSAYDYQLYYVITHNDLEYVIYFPEENPNIVHIIKPLNTDDGTNFYYFQITNAVHLAVYEGYYDLLKVFAERYDHSTKFVKLYLRNKAEKTLRVRDELYWIFEQCLTSTLSI